MKYDVLSGAVKRIIIHCTSTPVAASLREPKEAMKCGKVLKDSVEHSEPNLQPNM